MIRIAHRGASGHKFENSISAFKEAIQLGIEYVEFDVRKTSDNQLIVFHDDSLDRCTNAHGWIEDYTYKEITDNILLLNDEKIPLLSEVCQLLKNHDVKALVELKDDNSAQQVLQEILKNLPPNKFIIGSFFHKQILELKIRHPELLTCIMFECYPIDLASYVKKVKADFVAVGFKSSTANLIAEIRLANAKTFLWTVNDKEDIAKAKALNVDGIISNYPDRI